MPKIIVQFDGYGNAYIEPVVFDDGAEAREFLTRWNSAGETEYKKVENVYQEPVVEPVVDAEIAEPAVSESDSEPNYTDEFAKLWNGRPAGYGIKLAKALGYSTDNWFRDRSSGRTKATKDDVDRLRTALMQINGTTANYDFICSVVESFAKGGNIADVLARLKVTYTSCSDWQPLDLLNFKRKWQVEIDELAPFYCLSAYQYYRKRNEIFPSIAKKLAEGANA